MHDHGHHDERRPRATARSVWGRVLRRILGNGDKSLLAQLDELRQDEHDRREHERQARWQNVAADAEDMLRRMNCGEPAELAAEPDPEPAAPGPYDDVSDDELDLDSMGGRVEAKRRGLVSPRFCQSQGDYEAQVAAMKADHWRALTGERTRSAKPAGFACVARRVSVRSRGRRERRPGHRKTASASRAGPGDSDPGDSDPPDAAGSLDDDWLACAGLSAADAQRAADRIATACGGVLTPLVLRGDVEVLLPDLRGDARSAALIVVYRRLPAALREQYDLAVRAGTEGGGR